MLGPEAFYYDSQSHVLWLVVLAHFVVCQDTNDTNTVTQRTNGVWKKNNQTVYRVSQTGFLFFIFFGLLYIHRSTRGFPHYLSLEAHPVRFMGRLITPLWPADVLQTGWLQTSHPGLRSREGRKNKSLSLSLSLGSVVLFCLKETG